MSLFCYSCKFLASPGPRRSPRTKKSSFDIFLFNAEKKNSEIKVTGSASVISKVDLHAHLEDIKLKIREIENDSVLFIPIKGLYWLRKGKKQCVNLNTEEDLEACKNDYIDGKGNLSSIRLACASIPLGTGKFMYDFWKLIPSKLLFTLYILSK